ncbi:MAG: hypothetical protein ACW97G_11925 [Candidatus Thorarchaeota archaeon]|jgi:hypothetical protein
MDESDAGAKKRKTIDERKRKKLDDWIAKHVDDVERMKKQLNEEGYDLG